MPQIIECVYFTILLISLLLVVTHVGAGMEVIERGI
jgi:hypothetical protein